MTWELVCDNDDCTSIGPGHEWFILNRMCDDDEIEEHFCSIVCLAATAQARALQEAVGKLHEGEQP